MGSKIFFEDGTYTFEYTDEYGSVVTDGTSIEKLRRNIREAMQLHFEGVQSLKQQNDALMSRNFSMPLTLSFSDLLYAFDVRAN